MAACSHAHALCRSLTSVCPEPERDLKSLRFARLPTPLSPHHVQPPDPRPVPILHSPSAGGPFPRPLPHCHPRSAVTACPGGRLNSSSNILSALLSRPARAYPASYISKRPIQPGDPSSPILVIACPVPPTRSAPPFIPDFASSSPSFITTGSAGSSAHRPQHRLLVDHTRLLFILLY